MKKTTFILLFYSISTLLLSLDNKNFSILFSGKSYFSQEILLKEISGLKKDSLTAELSESIIAKLLDFYAEHGFPFVNISPKLNNKYKVLELNIDSGEYTIIDKIVFKDSLYTSNEILKRVIKSKTPSSFKISLYKNYSKKLLNTQLFVQEPYFDLTKLKSKSWEVNYHLKEKKFYYFSAIGGIENSGGEDNLLGIIDFKSENLFGTFRQLKFYWERQSEEVEKNTIRYLEPWIFNFDFSIEFYFDLFSKKDENYEQSVGVDFIFDLNENLKCKVGFGSFVLKEYILGTTQKVEFSNYKLSLEKQGELILVRNSYFRKYKYSLESNLMQKTRTYVTKSNYNDFLFKFNSFYNLPFKRNFYYINRINLSYLYSNSLLLEQELLKLGGAQSLRGFFERQFKTNIYSVIQNEFHVFLNTTNISSLYILNDLGIINDYNGNNNLNKINFEMSLGLGIKIVKNNTTVNLSFASNKNDNFSKAKIHLKYTQSF